MPSIVALIQWIPRLTKTPLPSAISDRLAATLAGDDLTFGPVDAKTLRTMDPEDAAQLVQWTDLIIFDYLTGNYDRIASMMVIFWRKF